MQWAPTSVRQQLCKPSQPLWMLSGDGDVGSLREVHVVSGLPAGSSTERLEILDDEQHVLSFSVVGGDHRPPSSINIPEDLIHNHTHAVGPNQCSSAVVQTISAPVDAVWSVVRRFDNPQAYKHFLKSCHVILGDGDVGSLREVHVVSGLPAGSSTERLEILDDEQHVLSFSVVGGDHRIHEESLDDGLLPLMSDKDASRLVEYVPRFRELELYIETGVSLLECQMMERIMSKGQGVVIEEIVDHDVIDAI
ncbi:PYR1-like 6 [Artemisia annua]|uniref:PYR1-like 6 n=1 Tax=Artemisia annua TaxID=35608 RepID=A0A2U1LMP3_ARTAN|nr:PYR1-like 6 [Artemisia annua]